MTAAVPLFSRFLKLTLLATVCAALAGVTTSAAKAAPVSCWEGYSYNGVQSPTRGYGISATLTLANASVVGNGHVAAWVGVGGLGMGPNGTDEWVQAGIAHDAGRLDVLYYEYKRPGDADATYVRLKVVTAGEKHSIVVSERLARKNYWTVIVDGVPVHPDVFLPGSHGAFQPVATAENWDGGIAGSCNAYSYGFSNLKVRSQSGGAWKPFDLSRVLRDPAYRMTLRPSGFSATSR
jgi:hypothetical protein